MFHFLDYKELILTTTNINITLQEKLIKEIIKQYGEITKIKVAHSTKKGKAILVSGSSLLDLEHILNKTQNKGIDIYTNSNLLIAHSFFILSGIYIFATPSFPLQDSSLSMYA